jgi:hypothetical protein
MREDRTTGPFLLFGPQSVGGVPDLKVPDANLLKVLDLLCVGLHPSYGRDVRELGDAYEAIMEYRGRLHPAGKGRSTRGASLRKKTGMYYTPDSVVEYVVKTALGRRVRGLSSRQILGIKVLDPAMGSGRFLLRAAGFLAAAYGRARAKEGRAGHGNRIPAKDLSHYKRLVVRRCLYGVDTDPIAAELAKLSLWLFAGGVPKDLRELEKHLRCGDALSGASFGEDVSGLPANATDRGQRPGSVEAKKRGRPFHWPIEFPEVLRGSKRNHHPGFDVVIGNPPYLSFSGRQKAVSGESLHGINRKNGRSGGWPSAHGLFILRAAELVADKGIISFVTPGQVGLLRGYGPVRASLLEVCNLLEVRYWGEDTFRGVTTPVLTFVAGHGRARHRPGPTLVKHDGRVERFKPKDDAPWYVSPYRSTFERLAGLHGTVDGFADPGVHTGNVAAKILLSVRRPGSVPIIEGRQIHPFHCAPPGRWLNTGYQPSGDEYFRISDPRVYRDVDILIRQTASRPVAARHLYRCHFRNSALGLKVPEGFSVEYLIGILNSEVAGILYQAYSPEALQRSFPQIKVNALKHLPIPDPRIGRNRPVVAQIETIVRAIEAGAREGRGIDRLLGELNRLVHRLYG